MLGQEGNKVEVHGSQAREIRETLARSINGKFNENERKVAKSLEESRQIYQIKWR